MKETSEAVLEKVDDFIAIQARKLMYWQLLSKGGRLDSLEVDELIQRVRIKLWGILEKHPIERPFSYTRRIVYSEFIDMKRQQKQLLPLPDNENEGFYPFNVMATDPADEVMQRIESYSLLHYLVQMMMDLPARQQIAMISFLWRQVEDTQVLNSILTVYGLERKVIEWPTEKIEKKTLMASLSVARQKMAKKRHLGRARKEMA